MLDLFKESLSPEIVVGLLIVLILALCCYFIARLTRGVLAELRRLINSLIALEARLKGIEDAGNGIQRTIRSHHTDVNIFVAQILQSLQDIREAIHTHEPEDEDSNSKK